MQNTKVGFIYSTKDYDEFHKLNGNRTVLQQRKNMILASIRERGWIRNPIVVNEKMEMIDGQGRFEALKELDMPIEYCISEGATIDDCIALNLKQKNWTTIDYINCYAEMGKKDYVTLLKYIQDYKELGVEPICIMLSEGNGTLTRDCKIYKGNFVLRNPETAKGRMDFLKQSIDIIGRSRGRLRCWTLALKFVFDSTKIDNERMLKVLAKYINLLNVCVDADGAVKSLEAVYNYNMGAKGRVYFIPEYDKYREGTRRAVLAS